jgi:hypothetical protein
VIPRGRNRLAAAQIWFANGQRHRDYLIFHQTPHFAGKEVRPGRWWARSMPATVAPGALDLRKPEQARKLEAALVGLDLEALRK